MYALPIEQYALIENAELFKLMLPNANSSWWPSLRQFAVEGPLLSLYAVL